MHELHWKILKSFFRFGEKNFIPSYTGLMIYNPDLFIVVQSILDHLQIGYDVVREYKIRSLPYIPSLVFVDDVNSDHIVHSIEAIKRAKSYPEYAHLFPILFAKDYPISTAYKAGFGDVIQLPFDYEVVSSLILARVKYFYSQHIPDNKKPYIIGTFLVDYRIMGVFNMKKRELISLTPTEFKLLVVISFLDGWWTKRELALWIGKTHTYSIPLLRGNLSAIVPHIITCARDNKYLCKRRYKPLLLTEDEADKIIKKMNVR